MKWNNWNSFEIIMKYALGLWKWNNWQSIETVFNCNMP